MGMNRDASRQPQSIRFLLSGGVIGPILFIVVFLIDGFTRNDYNPWFHFVSSLSNGDRGWVQITNFVVCGVLVLCFAIGLRQVLRPGPGSWWGPILLFVFGAGLIGAGIFVADPILGYPPGIQNEIPSLAHTLHDSASMFVFASLPIAIFVLVRRFVRDRAGWVWITYSIVTALLFIGLFFSFGTMYSLHEDGSWPGAPVGLFQRLCIVVGWCWIALYALRLLRISETG